MATTCLPAISASRKAELSHAKRRLIELMQRLYFGTIQNLHVRAGEPIFDPKPRTIRRRKNGANTQPRPQVGAADFALKREWVEFFEDLVAIGDGVIIHIEVAHGLPIYHDSETQIDV
jgi:hypothetical protein